MTKLPLNAKQSEDENEDGIIQRSEFNWIQLGKCKNYNNSTDDESHRVSILRTFDHPHCICWLPTRPILRSQPWWVCSEIASELLKFGSN